MKYLLLLLALLAVAWWVWRQARRLRAERPPSSPPAAPPAGAPQAMLRCAHCGLHLPAAEAVAGARGSYCSAVHLQLAEPPPR